MKTVFLDRDGVINRNRARGDYVKSWEEFQFLPGACDAMARLTKGGVRLLVVTNQACIAKGIVSWATVQEIHERMMQEIARGEDRSRRYSAAHTWRMLAATVASQRQACSDVPARSTRWT